MLSVRLTGMNFSPTFQMVNAAVNAPSLTVLSGPMETVVEVEEELTLNGVVNWPLVCNQLQPFLQGTSVSSTEGAQQAQALAFSPATEIQLEKANDSEAVNDTQVKEIEDLHPACKSSSVAAKLNLSESVAVVSLETECVNSDTAMLLGLCPPC
jgi:hypothetical protein